MRDILNVEKSAFRMGEYVGYGSGTTWRVRRTLTKRGIWIATPRADSPLPPVYAFTLADIGARITTKGA